MAFKKKEGHYSYDDVNERRRMNKHCRPKNDKIKENYKNVKKNAKILQKSLKSN